VNFSDYVIKKEGSCHVLVDGYYTDVVKIPITKGPQKGTTRNCYFLCLLFSRKSKSGKITNRFRRVGISTSKTTTEFNKFCNAYSGSYMILAKGCSLDFKKFTTVLIDEIRSSDFNFRVQWGSSNDNRTPVIDSITKIDTVLETRCPGMVWPPEATRMYPVLLERNDILNSLYDDDYELVANN